MESDCFMKINKMELIQRIVNLCPDQTELTPNELKDLLKEYKLDIGIEDNDVIKKEKEEITNHSEGFKYPENYKKDSTNKLNIESSNVFQPLVIKEE